MVSRSAPAASLRGRTGRLIIRARSLRSRSWPAASDHRLGRAGARHRITPSLRATSPCDAERVCPTEALSPRPPPSMSWPTSGLGPLGQGRGGGTMPTGRLAARVVALRRLRRPPTDRPSSLPSRRSSPTALAHQVGSAAHSQARQRQPALALLGRLTLATESPPRASFSHPVTSNPASTAAPFPSPGYAGSVTPGPSMRLPAPKPLTGSGAEVPHVDSHTPGRFHPGRARQSSR